MFRRPWGAHVSLVPPLILLPNLEDYLLKSRGLCLTQGKLPSSGLSKGREGPFQATQVNPMRTLGPTSHRHGYRLESNAFLALAKNYRGRRGWRGQHRYHGSSVDFPNDRVNNNIYE